MGQAMILIWRAEPSSLKKTNEVTIYYLLEEKKIVLSKFNALEVIH